jgi:hypothetical protein
MAIMSDEPAKRAYEVVNSLSIRAHLEHPWAVLPENERARWRAALAAADESGPLRDAARALLDALEGSREYGPFMWDEDIRAAWQALRALEKP